MPAFATAKYHHLRDRVAELAKLSASWRRCPLTLEDINLAFIDPEDRPAFTQVGKLVGDAASSMTLQFGAVDGISAVYLNLSSDGEHSPLLPDYARNRMGVDDGEAATAAREKVTKFVQTMADVQFAWMQVRGVVEHLNSICRSPAQFRAMFPAAASLFGPDEQFKSTVDQLRTFKSPSDLPGTSLEFRVAAREAAGLVTKTAMMPTDKKPPTNKHVTLRPAYLSRRVSWGDGILYPLDLT